MEPTTPPAKAPTNPLLAHLNDIDESHASARVDFAHPGTVVQPMPKVPVSEEPKPDPAPPAPPKPVPELPPQPPVTPPPTPLAPTAPKSPHNRRPIVIAIIIVLILAMAGAGAYWWFKIRKPASSSNSQSTQTAQTVELAPVTPASLSQANSSGQPSTAGAALKSPLELDFTISTSANSGTATPEVEVEPLGTAFTNKPNYTGPALTASGSSLAAKVPITDLKDGSYHWQARMTVGSSSSDWVAFGQAGSTKADFVIDSTPPKAPVVTTVGSQTVKTGATSLTTTTNPTTISGTSDPGSAISIAITPDNQSGTATADANGNWTVTLQQALANGDHTLSIASADAAGNTSKSSFAISSNTATVAPTTQKVAATGNFTQTLTSIGLFLIAMAAGGLVAVARSGKSKV